MSLEVRLQHKLTSLTLDVSFQAQSGITTLFGASGAGKTTIINVIAGLMRADHAFVQLGDQVLVDTDAGLWRPPHKRRIGYVFQDARLFPHLTVRRNLHYGRRVANDGNGAHGTRDVERIIDLLGIAALLPRMPRDLSGGEKQRVAIGRALLSNPALLLLDEPLAALDESRKGDILPYLERLRDEAHVPMIHVSHSVAEVARLADQVVVLEAGRVIKSGPTSAILSDPNLAPVGVRAVGAVLMARVSQHFDDGLSEIVAGDVRLLLPQINQPVGTQLRVRIAAHDVMLSKRAPVDMSALNAVKGEITHIRSGSGPGALVTLQTSAGPILSRITQRSVARLELGVGVDCFALLKTVSIGRDDVGFGFVGVLD